jgi:hypothetical protein
MSVEELLSHDMSFWIGTSLQSRAAS